MESEKSKFITQYEYRQKWLRRIRDEKNEKKFFELFDSKKDLDLLLESIEDYNLHTDYIKIDNFLNILKNEVILGNLTEEDKTKIAAFIHTKITESDKDAKLMWYRLYILLQKYTEYISVDDIKKLLDIDWIKNILPSAFMHYFRVKLENNLYRDSFMLEVHNTPDIWEKKSITFNEEDIFYIKEHTQLKNKFVNFLCKNIDMWALLLNQVSHKPYSASDKIIPQFIDLIKNLTSAQIKKFSQFLVLATKQHVLSRYWHSHRGTNLRDFFSSELCKKISPILAKENKSFISNMLNIFSSIDYNHFDDVAAVFIYGLSHEDIKGFVSHKAVDSWNFFRIYYAIAQSHRKDKNILIEKFKSLKWDEIANQEQRQEEYKKEQKERVDKEHQKKRKEIEDLCVLLSEKNGFSERLIYYYEGNPDIFLDSEIALVKSQVEKILADKKTFNPHEWILKHNRESPWSKSFSMPGYIPTLEKCIKLAPTLWINLSLYQWKVIYYLPFSFSGNEVLDTITDLDDQDIKHLLQVYSKERDEKDDLRRFYPSVFLSLCQKFPAKILKNDKYKDKAVENLKNFLKDSTEDVHLWTKKEIIKLVSDYVDKSFYEDELTHYIWENNLNTYHYFNDFLVYSFEDKEERERYELWTIANAVLIEKYKDKKAIERRLDQLKTIAVSVSSPPPDQVYSPTLLMQEVDRSGDYVFLNPLSQVITYNNRQKDVIEILKYSFSKKIAKDENLVQKYLWDFVFVYYDNIEDEDIQYSALIELKSKVDKLPWSDKFLTWKFPQFMRKWSGEQLEKFHLLDENKKLKNENVRLSDQNYDLEKENKWLRWLDIRNILFVEWKTDKRYLEIAYSILYPDRVMPFRIIVWWWAKEKMISFLCSYLQEDTFEEIKIFALFDRGYNWIKWRMIDKELYKKYGYDKIDADWTSDINKNIYFNKHVSNKYHCMLLPVPEYCNKLVFKSSDIWKETVELNKDFPILGATYGLDSKCDIEHLLYCNWLELISINGSWSNYFSNKEWIWGGVVMTYTWNGKNELLNYVLNNTQYFTDNNIWNNFKPIFDYIHTVLWISL
jgi:hypothetical protein